MNVCEKIPKTGKITARRMITWLRLYLGYTGGTRRIYCICRERHLTVRPKRRPNGITKADRQAEKSENLIKRDFTTKTQIKNSSQTLRNPRANGKLYLAAVLDCFDGSIQGFAMVKHMQAELCVEALENACRHNSVHGLILHSAAMKSGKA